MTGTTMVHGSGGEVMAPVGNGTTFIPGKVLVRVVAPGTDSSIPSIVRRGIVGLEVWTIFTLRQIADQIGEETVQAAKQESHFAYVSELIKELERCGKHNVAHALLNIAGGVLDLFKIEEGTYEVLD